MLMPKRDALAASTLCRPRPSCPPLDYRWSMILASPSAVASPRPACGVVFVSERVPSRSACQVRLAVR